MATKVTVSLADSLYQRAQRFARLHDQDMEEAISSLLEEGLAVREAEEEILDWSEPDPIVDRERQAYVAMHSLLKERYFGKYVAIYQGELVDFDDDPAALATRTRAKYAGEFVLITQVRPEAIQTFVMRSPRIVRD
jgi:hypothetical protein